MDFWKALAATSLAGWVKSSDWAYPLLETAHLIGLGLLFGSIVMMDLRLLGLSRVLPIGPLGRHLLPWAWTGFAINLVSGALLFISDAPEFAANSAFRVKVVLIALAGLNVLLFHRGAYRRAVEADPGQRPRAASLVAGTLSILIWVGVIAAGRMIAYVE